MRFEQLLGFPPEQHADKAPGIDYRTADRVLPHPIYALQAWVAIINPGQATDDTARALLTEAHERQANAPALDLADARPEGKQGPA